MRRDAAARLTVVSVLLLTAHGGFLPVPQALHRAQAGLIARQQPRHIFMCRTTTPHHDDSNGKLAVLSAGHAHERGRRDVLVCAHVSVRVSVAILSYFNPLARTFRGNSRCWRWLSLRLRTCAQKIRL